MIPLMTRKVILCKAAFPLIKKYKVLLPPLTFSSFKNSFCEAQRFHHRAESIHSKQNDFEVLVGKENVSSAEAICKQHGRDEGIERGLPPNLVVWPRTTEEVSAIARICYENKFPMIPFGTGTGFESGVCAVQGGVCVDMCKMDQILNFNMEDFDVTVQPGVSRQTLNHFLKEHGLWFPVDPGADASLCGMTATGASGTNAVRYGTMRTNVLNVETVLADGRTFYTAGKDRRTKKTSAGYNLTNLFVGSEGTLGFITKSILKLYGLPETMVSAVCTFPTVKAAVDTCVETLQTNIPIARIELMDDVAMDLCNKHNKMSYAVAPTLFLEFHGSEESVTSEAKQVLEIAESNGGSEFQWARETEVRNRLWKARHSIFWATVQARPGHRVISTDVCVPITKLPDLIAQTKLDVQKTGSFAPILGHVGDGNFHALIMFNPDDPADCKKAKDLANRIAKRALALDGTCTGEHGIGMGKILHLEEEMGPIGVDVMKAIKNSLDPLGLMNPGKVLRSV